MLQSFIDWLDGQIQDKGLGKVLVGLFAIVGSAGTLGTLFGSFPLRASAVVMVALLSLSYLVYSHVDRDRLRKQFEVSTDLLNKYCRRLEGVGRSRLQVARITRWHQTVEINNEGDATITRLATYVATSTVHFLTFYIIYYGTSRQGDRVRGRVKAVVRQLSDDGRQGARILTTHSWESRETLKVTAHFIDSPIEPGQSITLEARIIWPQFSRDLVRGGIETFDVRTPVPLALAEQVVEIERRSSRERFSASGVGRLSDFEITEANNKVRVFCAARSVEQDVVFGVRIDKLA